MSLNRSKDLKEAGFDSSLLGFDDTEKDGVDLTALDRFLNSILYSANQRLSRWVNVQDSPEFKQAEFYLALVQILPFVWAKHSVGESSLDIEGMKISVAKVSEEEKKQILKSLLDLAENSVYPYLIFELPESVISHDSF
jgi:hypothetical protein